MAIRSLAIMSALLGPALSVRAQTTAFTYEGRLADGGAPAQGLNLRCDLNGIPTNATVLWLDGTSSLWTAANVNAAWFAGDGYTLTYTNANTRIAQPTMQRDQNGLAANAPPLLVIL